MSYSMLAMTVRCVNSCWASSLAQRTQSTVSSSKPFFSPFQLLKSSFMTQINRAFISVVIPPIGVVCPTHALTTLDPSRERCKEITAFCSQMVRFLGLETLMLSKRKVKEEKVSLNESLTHIKGTIKFNFLCSPLPLHFLFTNASTDKAGLLPAIGHCRDSNTMMSDFGTLSKPAAPVAWKRPQGTARTHALSCSENLTQTIVWANSHNPCIHWPDLNSIVLYDR